MRKVFTLVLSLFLCVTVFAQSGKTTPEQKAAAEVQKMQTVLTDLSDDQVQKLTEIKVNLFKDLAVVETNKTLSTEEKKAEKAKIFPKYGKEQAQVLTAEQRKTWKTWQEEQNKK